MSHQNLMDMSSNMNSDGVGKTSNPMRNSLLMDSSPHSQQQQMMDGMIGGRGGESSDSRFHERGRDTLRRSQINSSIHQNRSSSSNPNTSSSHPYNANTNSSGNSYQQAMSDHFDHYKRPASRDSSVDRFSRARSKTRGMTPEIQPQSQIQNSSQSRASSRHRTPFAMDNPNLQQQSSGSMSGLRSSSNMALDAALMADSNARLRAETPGRNSGKESPIGGGDNNSVMKGSSVFDENIIRQRGLGQEIPPVPYTPKRTESLFLKPAVPKAAPSNLPKIPGSAVTNKRKKSLPDANVLPQVTPGMSRDEVAALGSARRQELHRMQDEAERLRANPLLYLFANRPLRNWFSRQKLMVLVLFINLSLAIMFLQLLSS